MTKKTRAASVAFFLVIGGWWILSKIYHPLIIPTIPSVLQKTFEILTTAEMLSTIGVTLLRLVTALALGTLAGFAAGLAGSLSKTVRALMEPIIGILQVVPPVSLLILAILWFGFNGKPAICIVVMAVFPTMTISIQNGILNIDRRLMDMGNMFKLSRKSMLIDILIPSIKPAIASGWRISLGLACKTMVMGEVLTTPTGIGGALSQARLDLEPETVIAWTIIVVLIFKLINKLTTVKQRGVK